MTDNKRNTGWYNTGSYNTGSLNTGSRNTGSGNTGAYNTGSGNTGSRNTGSYNTGSLNTGSRNTGSRNTGSYNTGSLNTGSSNTGSLNTGGYNTGWYNTCDGETGLFNTESGTVRMFNQPTGLTQDEAIERIPDVYLPLTEWIPAAEMTAEQKAEHPEHETTGGFLLERTYHEAWAIAWDGLDADKRQAFLDLPNFDAAIFREVTGIDVGASDDDWRYQDGLQHGAPGRSRLAAEGMPSWTEATE